MKTGSVAQYGTYTAVSDVLELQAYDDVISGATEEMGASAGDTQEQILADAFLAENCDYWCANVDASGNELNRPVANGTMGWSTTNGCCKLTGAEVNRIVTIMKSSKVPTINGKYVFVVHPKVAFELRKDPEWVHAHQYAATREIFNGEIGELHGATFIENPDAPIYGGNTYKNKEGGVTYATYVFGKDAFGHINPEGGNLQMIIKPKEQAGGPLNQFSTIGYKFMDGVVVLYSERMMRVWSCTSFSATDSPST